MGLYWIIFSLLHDKENIENHIVFPGFEGHLIRSYAERRVPNKIVQGISSLLVASIVEVQISNTMSGEWKGYVRYMAISLCTCTHCYKCTLVPEMNLHCESVLIHLPPSASACTSPFGAILTTWSSLVAVSENAGFSGCAFLSSKPQTICQTGKPCLSITLNSEPIGFWNLNATWTL